MALTPAGVIKHQFFTNAGLIASGYKLFTYTSGTASKANTWQDSGSVTLNSNPIVLDSSGRCSLFTLTSDYKFVLAAPTSADPPAGADIIWTVDGVSGIPPGAANIDVVGPSGAGVYAAGEVVYWTGTVWGKASSAVAAASTDANLLGIVVSGVGGGADITVRISGRSTDVGAVVTGSVYYIGNTAGTLVTPAPAIATNTQCPFGVADSATSIIFPINQTIWASLRTGFATYGYSTGQSNGATTSDYELTNYPITIPADFLDTPGATLILEGQLSTAATANTKTMKVKVGSGTLVTVISEAAAGGSIVPFRIAIVRRTSTTAAVRSVAYIGAASGGAPTVYMVEAAMSGLDWTTFQALKIYVHTSVAAAAADILMTDLWCYHVRGQVTGLV